MFLKADLEATSPQRSLLLLVRACTCLCVEGAAGGQVTLGGRKLFEGLGCDKLCSRKSHYLIILFKNDILINLKTCILHVFSKLRCVILL